MTQTISRLYSSRENAEAAAKELRENGFGDDEINVVAPADRQGTETEAAETPDDGIVASILRGGVPKAHAPAYAEGVHRGETLVSVRVPFGFAGQATGIMAKFSPTEADLPDHGYELPPHDDAAPLSSAFGWPVLSGNPAPLSSLLGWRTLSTRRPPAKPDQELVDDPAPLSKSIGMDVLSDNPAPLSARLGWRLLSDNPAPLSKRLGWRLLSDNPAPLSTSAGWPLLSDDPAPLSRRLGWRLLSNNPTPLSTRLGWRVLLNDRPPTAP